MSIDNPPSSPEAPQTPEVPADPSSPEPLAPNPEEPNPFIDTGNGAAMHGGDAASPSGADDELTPS